MGISQDHTDDVAEEITKLFMTASPILVEDNINKRSYLKAFCDKIYKLHKRGYEVLIDGFINEYNEPSNTTPVSKCMSCEVDIKKDEGLLFCGECGT